MFKDYYKGKKVLVTGHTGFKGSWLCNWLVSLGADVSGISDSIITNPSLFEITNLEDEIDHHICDVTDSDAFKKLLVELKPDIIFHLAAQAIVSTSYENPLETIMTNAYGTANVCDYLKGCDAPITCILITSDKCYENVEWEYGYREDDILGGKDIYSSSKACAEIIYASYFHSFLKNKENVKVCSARAGNVIGGGDWAKDRIVVDMFKSWTNSNPVKIRSPKATRPWQHVLEPLSGYLHLAASLNKKNNLNGQSFNFGPRSEQNRTVTNLSEDLFARLKHLLPSEKAYEIIDNKPFHEAGLLKLCCDKALMHLNWEANLSYEQCVDFIGDWYIDFLNNNDMKLSTSSQIQQYTKLAMDKNLTWTK
jgi:CDP-glucose 4,6-dehydratase